MGSIFELALDENDKPHLYYGDDKLNDVTEEQIAKVDKLNSKHFVEMQQLLKTFKR